jgi:hypothetical protein
MRTIATYLDLSLADIVCGRLIAEGFHAYVTDSSAALANDGGIIGAQGIRIQVPDEEAAKATSLLRDIEQ